MSQVVISITFTLFEQMAVYRACFSFPGNNKYNPY